MLKLMVSTAIVALSMLASTSHASLLSYEMNLTAGIGSVVDFGDGLQDITAIEFQVSGVTTSDTDLSAPDDSIGVFAAEATFDFGVLGNFAADSGSVNYIQNCDDDTNILCVGLANAGIPVVSGIAVIVPPSTPVADVDVGQALGTNLLALQVPILLSPLTLVNSNGQSLTLQLAEFVNGSVSVTSVPAPASALFLILGFCLITRKHMIR